MRFVNWELISSPYNWAVVVLMVCFGLILLSLVAPQD